MSTIEEQYEEQSRAIARMLAVYLETTREFARGSEEFVFGQTNWEFVQKRLLELQQRHYQEFMKEAAQIMDFGDKCPPGYKLCNGYCIPEGESCQ